MVFDSESDVFQVFSSRSENPYAIYQMTNDLCNLSIFQCCICILSTNSVENKAAPEQILSMAHLHAKDYSKSKHTGAEMP